MVDIAAQTHQRLNTAAPTPLAERARKTRLVGERKPVTAVFADIVGSTSLAERIDPEDWTLIINAAFDEMSRCIFDYEGTIAQLQGDAIISFFGAPAAHEDDPERGVRAALAMMRAMGDYGAELTRSDDIDFRIRIGVSTGLVLVGNVGSDLRYDYTAIGDTMNLAARLEAAAEPGEILISGNTERLVRAFFELEAVGPLDLKGKSEATQAYRVVTERPQPTPTRGIAGLESPMVGRERELATLLVLAQASRARSGNVATIVAEPGMGKSRLLAELRDAMRTEAEQTAWVTAPSVSFGAQMPFHLVTSLLLDTLGLNQATSPAEIETALRQLLAELLPADTEALRYLSYLLGLKDEPVGGTLPSGEFLAERLAGALIRLFKSIAAQSPLVITFEDLHWADTASVDLLQALLVLPDEAPILILCVTRNEPEAAGWAVLTTARERIGETLIEVRLEPLDRLGSQVLVANLLEIDSLPIEIRDLIVEKAEGNPFFVEEVIRMLVEHGAIERTDGHWRATGAVRDVAIPETVHGLVLARIDRQPGDARTIARLASVIDRQFSLPLLREVARTAGVEADVEASITQLESAGLVSLASIEPELEYRFSHALIMEAAYQTVLRQERRHWHGLVGTALLDRYPDREQDLADRLARHFELAGDAQRATRYLVMAADRAASRNAMIDAHALYLRASELLPHAVEEDDGFDRLRVRVVLGLIASGLELMTAEAVWAILADGREAAERSGDDPGLVDLLFWEVMLRRASGQRPETSPELATAIQRISGLADADVDTLQRSQALARSGLYMWWSGDFKGSLEALDAAGVLFRERGDDIGAALTESYMAANYASLGSFAEADARMSESRLLSDGADDLAKLDHHLAEAALASLRGDYGASVRFARDCFDGSAALGALGCATVSGIILGASQMATGKVEEARLSLERSIDFAMQDYLAPQRMQGNVLLAAVHGMAGDLPRAQRGFSSAMHALAAIDSPYGKAQARLARGMVLAGHPAGDPERALEDLDAAAAAFDSLGARPSAARTLRARGLALAKLGRANDADASLRTAATMASEMGLLDAPWPSGLAELQAMGSAEPPIQRVD